jgi:hypothetical protein
MSNRQYMQQLSEVTQAVVLDDADRRCNVDAIIDNDDNLNLRLLQAIPAGEQIVIRRSSINALPPVVRNMFYYYRNPITTSTSTTPPSASSSSSSSPAPH